MHIGAFFAAIRNAQRRAGSEAVRVRFKLSGIDVYTNWINDTAQHGCVICLKKLGEDYSIRANHLLSAIRRRDDNRLAFYFACRMPNDRGPKKTTYDIHFCGCTYDEEKGHCVVSLRFGENSIWEKYIAEAEVDSQGTFDAIDKSPITTCLVKGPPSDSIYSSAPSIKNVLALLKNIKHTQDVAFGIVEADLSEGMQLIERKRLLCFDRVALDQENGEVIVNFIASSTPFTVPVQVLINELESIESCGYKTLLFQVDGRTLRFDSMRRSVIVLAKWYREGWDIRKLPSAWPRQYPKKAKHYFSRRTIPIVRLADADELLGEFSEPLLACLAFAPIYLFGLCAGLYGLHWGVFTATVIGALLGIRAWWVVSKKPWDWYTHPWRHGR